MQNKPAGCKSIRTTHSYFLTQEQHTRNHVVCPEFCRSKVQNFPGYIFRDLSNVLPSTSTAKTAADSVSQSSAPPRRKIQLYDHPVVQIAVWIFYFLQQCLKPCLFRKIPINGILRQLPQLCFFNRANIAFSQLVDIKSFNYSTRQAKRRSQNVSFPRFQPLILT